MFPQSVEAASTSNMPGETAFKSWIQRLKIRDEAEAAKRKAAEVDHESPSLDVRAAPSESLYPSDQSGQKLCGEEGSGSIRETASTKLELSSVDHANRNVEKSSVPDASRPILNKQKDHVGDLQSPELTESKEIVARQLAGGPAAASLKSGFGPWRKAKASIRVEEKAQLEPERTRPTLQRAFHGSGTTNFPGPMGATQTCKQAGEREQGAAGVTSRLTNSLWRSGSGCTQTEAIAHASLGKPPLPPLRPGFTSRGRPKFVSRPISLKTQGLPFLSGRLSHSPCVQGMPVSDRMIPDSQLIGPPLHMSTSREGVTTRKVVVGDEARMTRVVEETSGRGGASIEDPNPGKAGCADLNSVREKEHGASGVETGPHPAVLSASHTENNGVISAHMVSFAKVVRTVDFPESRLYNQSNCVKFTMVHPPPISLQNNGDPSEGSSAIIVKGVGFLQNANDATGVETAELPHTPAVTDFHLELPVPSIGESKVVQSGEVVLQTAVRELNGNALKPMPLLRDGSFDFLETSQGATRMDKADAGASELARSASSTPGYPWGLFTGAAGISRKAREQFVEVYNRARDDLKNQRTSHVISRVPDKETDDSSRLASGQRANACDVPNYMLEKETLESQKLPVGNFYGQEKFETLNGQWELTLEHVDRDGKALNLCLPEKEQLQGGRQMGCVAEGNVWGSQDKSFQNFQTIHGADGRAGPRVETGQHVNSPAALAMGFSLSTHNSRQKESAILPKHTEGLQEGELQFTVDSNIPQERSNDQNKDCQRKFEERSDAVVHVACKGRRPEGTMRIQDQDFLSKADLIHSQKVAPMLEESPLSKGLVRVAGVSDNRGDKNHGVSSLLGKRRRGVFPKVAISGMHAVVTGKVAIDGTERPSSRTEMPSNRPYVWLQRWHSTPHIGKGTQGHTHGLLNGVREDSCRGFAVGSFEFRDTNSNKLVCQTTEIRTSAEREVQEVKVFQVNSEKVFPSPAAMAIVGTATRQLCSAQLQRKGCLAFW